jgi:glucose/arabinose dehydrogenase
MAEPAPCADSILFHRPGFTVALVLASELSGKIRHRHQMKYFTPQLWIGFNSPRRDAAFKDYDEKLESYRKQLAELLPKLNPRARHFFREVCWLHDGTLARLEVGDRLDDFNRKSRGSRKSERQAAVRLFVLTENADYIYTLHYRNVVLVELKFPGTMELFPVGQYPNFGDWGYDELTAVKNGLFRHEILFASGSTIEIEFKSFTFQRKRTT